MMKKLSALLLAVATTASPAFAAAGRTATLDVTKMDCAACPITVRKALEKVPGVESARIDFKARRAVVAFDPDKTTPQALTRATGEAGYPSSLREVR